MDAAGSSPVTVPMAPAAVVSAMQGYGQARGATGAPPRPAALEDRDQAEFSPQAMRLQERAAQRAEDPTAIGRAVAPGSDLAKQRVGDPEDPKAGAPRFQEPAEALKEAKQERERIAQLAMSEGRELSDYERKRLDRLDQVDLLIREGKYQIDNFMVDRVAVRLAKLMV